MCDERGVRREDDVEQVVNTRTHGAGKDGGLIAVERLGLGDGQSRGHNGNAQHAACRDDGGHARHENCRQNGDGDEGGRDSDVHDDGIRHAGSADHGRTSGVHANGICGGGGNGDGDDGSVAGDDDNGGNGGGADGADACVECLLRRGTGRDGGGVAGDDGEIDASHTPLLLHDGLPRRGSPIFLLSPEAKMSLATSEYRH
ncbi:hypothetical protein FISHEDRAFT_55294 [Fistulina hepatica ATCC 64428]|uniref:Uncharacterized protein n=1 Tax=Fistulina hepatica ATCC 64428 TaxID=1128425 RepID=A0A0D7AMY8_9AGAR|nr:hypothetical protein FISHEDRAFT_55294 [Fistulina hepatica ATCC 64428]